MGGDVTNPIRGAGVAVEVLDGTGVSNVFLDGLWNEIRVSTDHVVLIGMVRVRVNHPAEKVGGGLVAGDQQQDGDVEQLGVGQRPIGALLKQSTENGV